MGIARKMLFVGCPTNYWHHPSMSVYRAPSPFSVGSPSRPFEIFIMRILIIEDDPKTREFLGKGLGEEGYTADAVANGLLGVEAAEDRVYDLVVLDVMMPGWDGWTTLAELRARKIATPVLFLTARDSVPDRVKGLELGAEDYLVKPFAWSEFMARVKNILRRNASSGSPPLGIAASDTVRIGDLEVEFSRMKARRCGKELDLTAKEFLLLAYLARRTGQVLSRNTLAEQVWDMNFSTDSNAVDVAMGRLRKKVDEGQPVKLIHTLRGLGYTLELKK
jgi:two-component system copper resistance phosphate regulon response regulator CusR